MNIVPVQAVISAMRPLTADTTLFTLRTESNSQVASSFLPGQFLELSLPGVGEIPISYCGTPSADGSIELCIRHVGHVTLPLKNTVPGDLVAVRGPFGRGFPLHLYSGHDLLLIAGGLGIAPLRSLLLILLQLRKHSGRIIILYGAREPRTLLFIDELLALKNSGDIELKLAVSQPGYSLHEIPGCQVCLLPELLNSLTVDPGKTCAFICGPPVVYRLLLAGLSLLGVTDERIYFSLERRMKCGVGLCGHCAVGTSLCCVDGPVFSLAELAGIESALG